MILNQYINHSCDFQNRQQQDMELIKQSLLDIKQCVKSSKAESDVLDPLYSDDKRERLVRDNEPNEWNAPM